MESIGTRIYSVAEIRDMVRTGFPDNFCGYLGRAPEGVRKLVLGWIQDGNDRDQLQIQITKAQSKSSEVIDEETAYEQTSLILQLNEKQQIQLKECPSICEGEEISEVAMETKDNPYADIEFKERIDVKQLCIHICEESDCKLHKSSFVKIQVVVPFGQRKNYGLMINACTECKKLFMAKAQLEEYIPTFRDKGIPYEVRYLEEAQNEE